MNADSHSVTNSLTGYWVVIPAYNEAAAIERDADRVCASFLLGRELFAGLALPPAAPWLRYSTVPSWRSNLRCPVGRQRYPRQSSR